MAPGAGDSKLRSEGGPSGGGGSKKSDKTMERNLNYAPRKMAIVCKAMLIRQRRKGAGADSADAARRRSRRFLLHRAEIVSLLLPPPPPPSLSFLSFFSFAVVHGPFGRISFPAIALHFTHLAHRFAFSTCRPTFRMVFSSSLVSFFPTFSRFIFALYNCAPFSYGRRNLR